jgi:hypothetical protein
MLPSNEKLITTKVRRFKIEALSEVDAIIYDLITTNTTGKVTINLSQGGFGPVEVEEKLKPSP